jgi:hypothetical protein
VKPVERARRAAPAAHHGAALRPDQGADLSVSTPSMINEPSADTRFEGCELDGVDGYAYV